MSEVKTTTVANTDAAAEVASSPKPAVDKKKHPGLQFRRYFTKAGVDPYSTVEWETRTASITDSKGNDIFRQENVETPKDWSMTATNIVASKYLHGRIGTPERESGVRSLITRVAETIRDWGTAGGYFRTDEDAKIFHDELVYILVHQMMAFNSPVWFNVGCHRLEPHSDAGTWHWLPNLKTVVFERTGYSHPQCSACFINSIQDTMESILTLAKTEGMLFKWGSGTGTNLSPIRGSMEKLSGGGTASGPLSFMKGFDAFAGVIKSGGKTRRAAKMVILNIDHPDIVDFIECKSKEEAKAWALIDAGYDGSGPDSDAYSSIFFQNANNSVRVTDDFMQAVEKDDEFWTRGVKDRKVMQKFMAKELLTRIADATWRCGDPGMQFDTTINRWHTSKNTARINASNPCSEYMFLDDSACNLASLNLMKFAPNGTFDVEAFRYAVDITITAQEILVDAAGYPTENIGRNSHDYRPLGLGYANLGALLMASGLPYDSDAGRDYAACVTAIMCGEAYKQSSVIAEQCPPLEPASDLLKANPSAITGGACPGFYYNREPFLDVIRMHRASVNNINKNNVPAALLDGSKATWDEALAHGEKFGYRNSQVTVLAPTGTIGFMMDCDTTGIEPDLALVKYKKLVGGGMIKIVNNTVPAALFKLGYTEDQANAIVSYIDATGTIEGAPHIKPEHLAVFDCSFKPAKGTRSIHYMGHLLMMAATQPFISGAISKTVNLPENASIDDIAEAYLQAWKNGLKAVAVYRDGCKKSQPLSAAGTKTADANNAKLALKPSAEDVKALVDAEVRRILDSPIDEYNAQRPPMAMRHRLPAERASYTHKFKVGNHEGYITVGLYPDGMPGEIFITMAKEGSTVSGVMDCFATAISIALQHGVPLKLLCEKFKHTRFEPSGWTGNPDINYASSMMDYLFRWLELRFINGQQGELFAAYGPKQTAAAPAIDDAPAATEPVAPTTDNRKPTTYHHASDALKDLVDMGDAPSCHNCGAIMTRNGSCYRCMSCGSTSGCS
ncbi:MAG TPA: vitamin B12-dependent ribonucleotide reductase [Terriglobales bacterium]|nr:vitamin B12-dependent ribonucleotide reductase [Terriglobales bacterium]